MMGLMVFNGVLMGFNGILMVIRPLVICYPKKRCGKGRIFDYSGWLRNTAPVGNYW